ncbi:phosphopantetheine-binding protein [Catenulispora pinisilvae]|uniref:phosphopantetheine-binding protein n=1 Tax=Catenulispora pinisilvae TaxID=2705253 RepID=UPI001891DCFA|nr:phosphopantetheine-binding protein [Catenulispora pinisilvae]
MADLTYETLVALLVEKFEVLPELIRPGVTFADLEVDSLFLVELLLVVEREVQAAIPDDALTAQDTLERAVDIVREQVATAGTR